MSYAQRRASASATLLRGLAYLLLFLAALFAALLAYIWFVSRPIAYVMHAGESKSAEDRALQRAALDQFQRHGACEHIGKAMEWKGRPALHFNVHPDFEQDEVGCIRAGAPKGFQLEKGGWF